MQTRAARQQAFLASRGFELGPLPILADETVCTTGALDLGNQRLLLQCLEAAETEDALAIHVPQEGCVLAGDTVMTGSFPMFGQPVMNEGLMGTETWLDTLEKLASLQPVHVLPGHGPVAHDAELACLKRLMRYFLDEVAARLARHMPLPVLLTDLEAHLPAWITTMPVVWGTPRYAILRVYRGLVEDATGEPGWQHYKPSAIPAGDAARVEAACATLTTLQEFRQVAEEFEAGGDLGSAIAVARQATHTLPTVPAAWVFLSDCLVRGAHDVVSVLEKGDFFVEARQALQRALQLDPHNASAHVALGRFLVLMAYRNGGDPRPGMAHLRQAIEQMLVQECGPQAALLAQAYFYTGMGHRTRGEEGQALASFKTALEHLPTFQPARLAQQV
jgi:tetratricopeptide (TPR) repeat protein